MGNVRREKKGNHEGKDKEKSKKSKIEEMTKRKQ